MVSKLVSLKFMDKTKKERKGTPAKCSINGSTKIKKPNANSQKYKIKEPFYIGCKPSNIRAACDSKQRVVSEEAKSNVPEGEENHCGAQGRM